LRTERELEQECTKNKGEEMTNLAIRQHVHEQPQRIAKEQAKSVTESFDIETDSLRKSFDVSLENRRNCDGEWGCNVSISTLWNGVDVSRKKYHHPNRTYREPPSLKQWGPRNR